MSFRFTHRRAPVVGAAVASLVFLAGCGSEETESRGSAQGSVTITDNHGQISVPKNPQAVVALDNTVFETLDSWGIDLVAAPKGLMGNLWSDYRENDAVLDVGTHREPNLENVVAAQPDLIIGGYRFSDYYDELKGIQGATIETNPRDSQDPISELQRQTELLGEIFDRGDDADELNQALSSAVDDAKKNYDGTASVAGLITSGGKINFAAPGEGRGVGSLFPTLGLVPAIDSDGSREHTGDEISVEAIAAANPEWLVVLDRDAAVEEGSTSAEELIEKSEALKNVPAVQKDQIVYLDPNFYITEGIQAYTALYAELAEAFAAAK